MENSKNTKRTAIIISDSSKESADIEDIAKEKFRTVIIDDNSYSFEYINEKIKYFSAMIISSKKASENNYQIFKQFEADPLLSPVPIIVYCHNVTNDEYAENCLENGAVDVIYPPFVRKLIIHKIESAMHEKNSVTF